MLTLGIATLEKGEGPANIRFTDNPCSSFIIRKRTQAVLTEIPESTLLNP
jgi:hypothetical protein